MYYFIPPDLWPRTHWAWIS